MSPSRTMTSAFLLSCGLVATADGQNSSLLHAPWVGQVVQTPSGPVALPALPTATTLPQAGAGQFVPPGSMDRSGSAAEASRSSASGPLAPAGPLAQPGPATQNNSVAGAPYGERPRVLLNGASWTYQPPPPRRVFRKNDVVTIRVDEITRVMAEGAAENRKRTLYEAILTDWVRLVDWRLKPDPQVDGDPAVTAESNSNYRAESSVESRESMTFNIAATVVDIRPNGNLVLEARKAIRVNDNLWETSLSGICRAEDIAPDNVVLSKDLIDLEIRKEDRGHLRDGYSRGWLQRFIDRFGFF